MVERVGILVVSYGSRASAVIDALSRSENYDTHFYVTDRQRNPFNLRYADEHVVIPDLDVAKIRDFVDANKNRIDFGICCPEGPIIAGIRDVVEQDTGVAMICPTKRYAIEASKASQRLLLAECCPETNPRFKIFHRGEYEYRSEAALKDAIWEFLDELGSEVAVKPDKPAAGKGVGVWGDHFTNRKQLFEHFKSIFESGSDVIIEEKMEGEESSFQVFCDGRNLVPVPDTRDYKRAFDSDMGQNTGGMGSYKDTKDWLPFMDRHDREEEERIVQKIFNALRGDGSNNNDELRGISFYVAFMHTREGAKILEINSRPGDPEIQNVLPVLKSDPVELCFSMIEGNLSPSKLECEAKATVVTYAVPMDYGGYRESYSGDRKVDLSGVYRLKEEYGDNLRVYPGSMELKADGNTYALGSRTVCTVGIGDSIEDARAISLDGIRHIDGALWNRWDVGAPHYIARSVERMKELRRG